MSFSDVLKKSFLEGKLTFDLGMKSLVVALAYTVILGLYIYFVYRLLSRKGLYSRSFNISLTALSVITAAIILSIQSSVVISLGMVGALSIVRFRTAIKEPMDLVFLFWSIAVGIICGAGLFRVAIIASIVITIVIIGLEFMPQTRVPQLLIVNAESCETEKAIMEKVKKVCRYPQIKSRNATRSGMDMIVELRIKDGSALLQDILKTDGVKSASLLYHDGELTC